MSYTARYPLDIHKIQSKNLQTHHHFFFFYHGPLFHVRHFFVGCAFATTASFWLCQWFTTTTFGSKSKTTNKKAAPLSGKWQISRATISSPTSSSPPQSTASSSTITQSQSQSQSLPQNSEDIAVALQSQT